MIGELCVSVFLHMYWYRTTEMRDQGSRQVTGWKKRFFEDILQQSYQHYVDLFGESKKTVKSATDRLEELQVVKRDFRTVSYGDGLVSNNVMYVELIPAKVYELTYPEEEPGMERQTKPCLAGASDKMGGSLPTKPDTPMENFGGRGIPNGIQILTNSDTGTTRFVHSLPPGREIPVSQNGDTNTDITAENTDRDHSNPINPSADDGMDGENVQRGYIEQIGHNIEYDAYMGDDSPLDRELYEELYELICEIVCMRHGTVRIGGEAYPHEMVRERFLKLNSFHQQYVIDCMQNTTVKIANVKAYLTTALFNVPATMKHYYQQEVNHDMYGGGWKEKGIT